MVINPRAAVKRILYTENRMQDPATIVLKILEQTTLDSKAGKDEIQYNGPGDEERSDANGKTFEHFDF